MGTTYSITISNFLHNRDDFKIEIDKQLKAENYIRDSIEMIISGLCKT